MEAGWFKLNCIHGVVGQPTVIVCLSLGRRDIADGFQQSVVVEPGHTFQGGHYIFLAYGSLFWAVHSQARLIAIWREGVVRCWLRPSEAVVTLVVVEEKEVERMLKQLRGFLKR